MRTMHRTSTPPSGPKSRGGPRGSTGPQSSSRGGIQKRRGPTPRVDRDGDLAMDSTSVSNARGRSGRGRGRGDTSGRGSSDGGRGRNLVQAGPPRGLFSGAALQRAIARGMASDTANIKSASQGLRMEGLVKEVTGNEKRRGQTALDEILVVGLKQSKASSNSDGGVKDLLAFLERKATAIDTPGHEAVRIRKSRPQADAMIISVRTEDTPRILKLNSFMFAGTQLQISMYDGRSWLGQDRRTGEPSQAAVETRQRLTDALFRRYNPLTKLLDLSALGKDPELVQMGTFETESTSSKFFSALMLIINQRFTDAQQKQDAILSVSLANNEFRNAHSITALASTLPDLKNLDLSNNKLEHTNALGTLRRRFRKLDHLVLSGNPIEKVDPGYKEELLRWYPSLRMLNGVQVRSDQEVAALAASHVEAAKGKTPLPIRPALFLDEGEVAENFLKQFLPAWDNDRGRVASQYYDERSTFSLNVNTSAPRAAKQSGTDETKPQMWDAYIKRSRNLLKINHLPARMSRAHVGVANIQQCWASLPPTRHPDLFAEGDKWLIECHSVPGLPDPTGQSSGGVGGLMIMVHGEFDELNTSTRAPLIKRSFDRSLVLGPGGPTGIRVLSDMLTYRAYGGSDAWIPEEAAEANMTTTGAGAGATQQIPEGFGVTMQGKAVEQVQKEMMVIELSQRTGMTLEYSTLCLEETGYAFDGALAAFETVKGNLPPQAFFR